MKHFGVTVCLAALFVQQQSLSIKEETQNRSLYLCEVLMSKNHICHNFNRGVSPYYRLGWREGRGPGVLWLCHDKICLISPPPRLFSILVTPLICNQFCTVLPLYSPSLNELKSRWICWLTISARLLTFFSRVNLLRIFYLSGKRLSKLVNGGDMKLASLGLFKSTIMPL